VSADNWTSATAESASGSSAASPLPHKRIPSDNPLFTNAFRVIGATMRDNRRRLVELAEERSLEMDHDACQRARSDLTNPRNRLICEIAWLPGVSPIRGGHLIDKLVNDPLSIRGEAGVPVLAHLNLMAAAFAAVDGDDAPDVVAGFIQEMADIAQCLSAEEVMREINDDRVVSGFPEIQSVDVVEAELVSRKRYFRDVMKEAINRLPAHALVEAMTLAVDTATAGGEEHAPELIDELVDSYALETVGFLEREYETAKLLIENIRANAPSGEQAVAAYVGTLEGVARKWDKVAQPIQLSAKARGMDHDASKEIAYAIRCVAIDLFNEHGMLHQSRRLTGVLKELFAEVPDVAERVDEDSEKLANIYLRRENADREQKEWEQEITYDAEVGLLFKDKLSISPCGVAWNNQRYPLDKVTRVRWGGTRHSVNGIPAGTTYTVAFGDNQSEAAFRIKKDAVYSAFIEKLWRAVGVRLLGELVVSLSKGNVVSFGPALLRDEGITLVKHKFFGSNELVPCTWSQTHIWNADGAFYIGAIGDKKTYVGLSYIELPNIHVLEQAVRIAFEKPGLRRLSEILQ
jgi:hypothetical protein